MVALGISLFVPASLAARSQQANVGPVCGPARAATVIESMRGRIYALEGSGAPWTERIFGCLRSSSHPRQLSPRDVRSSPRLREGTEVLNPPWAGGLMVFIGVDTSRLSVRAVNLRTGAPVECGAGGGSAVFKTATLIERVLMSNSGVIVWSSETTHRGEETGRAILACTANGTEVLDEGLGIVLSSLELHDGSARWIDSGRRRTASLP